jgi:hypothetical protein
MLDPAGYGSYLERLESDLEAQTQPQRTEPELSKAGIQSFLHSTGGDMSRLRVTALSNYAPIA